MSLPVSPFESAIHRFLAQFGIGAAEIEINAFGSQYPRGATVEGIVTMRGGQAPQRLEKLTVQLRAFSEVDATQTKTLATEILAGNLLLLPREVRELPFCMDIPDDARLSRLVSGMQEGCLLVGLAAVQGTWWARQSRVKLNITRHREIEAVFGALRWMGFTEESWYAHHLLRPNENEETTAVFRAPDHLQEQLTRLTLYHPYGKIILELRPHTLTSHVKGLIGGNKQQHLLQIPGERLISSNGQPNLHGALPPLKQVLSLSLALPDDPQSWMLRPSMSPSPDPETLLRPAMPTPVVSGDDLLRPTAPPETEQ
jgi:SpoOM protein